jgi:hypothetical protein
MRNDGGWTATIGLASLERFPALNTLGKDSRAMVPAGRSIDWFAEYTLTEPFGQC